MISGNRLVPLLLVVVVLATATLMLVVVDTHAAGHINPKDIPKSFSVEIEPHSLPQARRLAQEWTRLLHEVGHKTDVRAVGPNMLHVHHHNAGLESKLVESIAGLPHHVRTEPGNPNILTHNDEL
eukprot:TRINITY_DN12836_c0_g1_i1.p1 TRINITY_DN12836_c0_g1~~TRINITY_DN12836_c0_g1_i1.p1  ORF type:complete len:140 (+),score=4.34 TRINITY_DN12836_c0_g1_i1:46-420(+)